MYIQSFKFPIIGIIIAVISYHRGMNMNSKSYCRCEFPKILESIGYCKDRLLVAFFYWREYDFDAYALVDLISKIREYETIVRAKLELAREEAGITTYAILIIQGIIGDDWVGETLLVVYDRGVVCAWRCDDIQIKDEDYRIITV